MPKSQYPALALQELAPDRELELRGHVLHVLDPVVAEKEPTAHAVHTVAPANEL